MAHPYHNFGNNNINDFKLKDCISKGIVLLLPSGRTSRDKSIIDVLIFGIGYVLHHPATNIAILLCPVKYFRDMLIVKF
jgi:hypothetical protein